MTTLETPGEQLVGRKLAIEKRPGAGSIDHYVIGQHAVEELAAPETEHDLRIAVLSFVNVLGAVKRIPVVRWPGKDWEPVGTEHTGTPHHSYGPRVLGPDFKFSETMLDVLRRLDE